MRLSCLYSISFASSIGSIAVNRPRTRIRNSLHGFTEIDEAQRDEDFRNSVTSSTSSPLIFDVASIVHSSNYPWTVESLAASAPLLRNQDDLVILLVESGLNSLYSGGPLAPGVGIWFVDGGAEQLMNIRDQSRYVSASSQLSDIESLGPCNTLPFSTQNSINVQAVMNLQAEIQELRDMLNPQTIRRKTSQNPRRGVSRKQRTNAQSRIIKPESKTTTVRHRKGYNVTNDAAILRQRLWECGSCQIHNITSGLEEIISILGEQTSGLPGLDANTDNPKSIQGETLSQQVLTVSRRSNLSTTLRMVILSDTHGFENQFKKYANASSGTFAKLPDADVLVHCGDFYGPGRSIDAFLAAQTHIPTHIVVRGNHDPLQYSFSKAQYLTKRQTITLYDGTILEARPFVRSRNPQATLPDNCDVLISHEPPFGICDKTYRKEHVGSLSLRHAVESSPTPPAVWLCGHIHEGRGAVWHSFSSSMSSTAVVNAANANSGKARRVTTGPVIVDLVPSIEC